MKEGQKHRWAALVLGNPLVAPPLRLEGLDPQMIMVEARKLALTTPVASRLAALGHGRSLDPADGGAYMRTLAANIWLMDRGEQVIARLAELGIRAMPVKGLAFLLDLYHDDPGLRAMLDMDILVETDTFAATAAALVEDGWTRAENDAATTYYGVEARFWIEMVRGHKVVLEVHRRLSFPGRFTIDPGGIWARAVQHNGGWRMALEDSLLYLATHKAQHGYANAPKDLLDGVNLTRLGVDWTRFVERASEWNATAVAWYFLQWLVLLGGEVPTSVLATLTPSRHRRRAMRRLFESPQHPEFRAGISLTSTSRKALAALVSTLR